MKESPRTIQENKTRRRISFIGLLLCAASQAGVARGDTIFSDFGPGNSYDCCSAYTVLGIGSPTTVANAFTPASGFRLNQIDVAAGWVLGDNGISLSLTTDNGGQPASVIESWNLTNLPVLGTCCAVTTARDTLGVILQPGVEYWLVEGAIDSSSWDGWNANSIGAIGAVAQNDGSGWVTAPGSTLAAFDVVGSPVPEPASFVLLGTALVSIAGLSLRLNRRQGR